jgi:hypothetical protein
MAESALALPSLLSASRRARLLSRSSASTDEAVDDDEDEDDVAADDGVGGRPLSSRARFGVRCGCEGALCVKPSKSAASSPKKSLIRL